MKEYDPLDRDRKKDKKSKKTDEQSVDTETKDENN